MELAKKFIKDWGVTLFDSVPSDTKNLVRSCQKVYHIAIKVLNSNRQTEGADHKFRTPLPLCATLLWKCHETHEIQQWYAEAEATFDLPDGSVSIDLVRQCCNYSLIVYDIWPELNQSFPQPLQRIRQVYGCPHTDVLAHGFFHRQPGEVVEEPVDLNLPKFTLTVDHVLKKFVFCIRGTFSIEDAVTDMLCDEDPFCSGVAHSGIIAAVHSMEKNFKHAFLEALEKYPAEEYGILLTGHSLGGGTAVLLALNFFLDPMWKDFLKGRDIKCVAFAPPPVYCSKEALPAELFENIRIFINNGDLVTRASMATLAQFVLDLKTLDEYILMPIDVIGILRRNDLKEVEKFHKLLKNKVQTNFSYLQHPGSCYRISVTDTTELSVQRIESEAVHKRLLMFKSLIADHSILKYSHILKHPPYQGASSSHSHQTTNASEPATTSTSSSSTSTTTTTE